MQLHTTSVCAEWNMRDGLASEPLKRRFYIKVLTLLSSRDRDTLGRDRIS